MNLDPFIGITFDDVQIVPSYSEIDSRQDVDVETSISRNFKLKIPLIASPMDTVCEITMAEHMLEMGGLGVIHRWMSIEQQCNQIEMLVKSANDENIFARNEEKPEFNYPIAAAIGVNGDSQQRAKSLLDKGANILVIDVAHGHHILVKKMLEFLMTLKGKYEFDVIAGSIATAEAAVDLEKWGADGLRVGVGGGSVCETRIRTGIGVPQLQSVIEVAAVASVPIISDGGIRYPGDVAKAIVGGADAVMIGSLFAGTDEAPGETFVSGRWPDVKYMKIYRGMASATTKLRYTGAASHVEGASKMTESRGSVIEVCNDIIDGLRSSMSYVGSRTITEFRTKSKFIGITSAGLMEAHPHGTL